MTTEQSLKSRIIRYISTRPGKFINGGQIESLAMNAGFKASNASRRLRELAEGGQLDRAINNGTVWYRWHGQTDPYQEIWGNK